MTVRAAGFATVLVAVLLAGACGSSGSSEPQGAPPPPTTVPAGPPPTTAAAGPGAASAAGLGEQVLKTVTVSEPNPYGNFEYGDNSPDYQPGNAGNGVRFKYWDCQKAPADVFNNVVFRIEVGTNGDNGYLDGHDQSDRNPVEGTTPTGQGLIHIWGTGPEGRNHYPIDVVSEGRCKFQLDFVTQGAGGANARQPIWKQDGHGNDNLDTPALKTPWQLAWAYTCPAPQRFEIADDKLGGRDIVSKSGTGESGVFEQGGSAGARTLMVVTPDECTWSLAIYQ
ncbi:hypothetical protein ABT369_22025 [Dactylosporangium sp. NPDC000244]|uniref:hypothetical protein n=1 Tax=Dactylosporangium sp. NPDC000244 TaxID=3154365 RepID=UPI003322A880